MDAAIVRQGELVGRGLMAYETTAEVGAVEHLAVDVNRAQVMGLAYKTAGLMGRKQFLSWSQLVKIGRDRIVVHTDTAPEETASHLANTQAVTGLEVWTDGGDHIGRIVDLCFDASTGDVQQYLFALNERDSPAAALGADAAPAAISGEEATVPEPEMVSTYMIAPQSVISAGRKRMMIAEEDAQRAQHYNQLPVSAIAAATNKAADWRTDSLGEIPTDFGGLLQKGQSFAGKLTQQVKQRARAFTDEQLAHQDGVSADSLPEITDQLQAKAEQAKQQMQQRFAKAKDQFDSRLEEFGDRPLERSLERPLERLEDRLGNTPLGRSFGQTLNRFGRSRKRDQRSEPVEPIDIEAFEVWEEDE
ncbi:MAG: hypothetical protein WBD47_02965 [Phormidesmis sp.]